MSLFVNDSRSRGRSKSPGRRDRSRSRDTRAPSPPQVKPKKSSKKYYDEDDDESSSGDSRGSDHRSSKHNREKPRYEVAEPKQRRASPPDTPSTTLSRSGDYVQSSKRQYDDRREGKHASYADPERYEHGRPAGYTRHLSYSGRPEDYAHVPKAEQPAYAPPGQYKWEYDHPEESDKSFRPPPSPRPELARHLSLNASGNLHVNIGGGHPQHPQYTSPSTSQHAIQPLSPQYEHQPKYGNTHAPTSARPVSIQSVSTHPEYHRPHATSISGGRPEYAAPVQYQYADPSQHFTYTSKTDGRKPSYTQSAHPQILEVKPLGQTSHAPPSPGLAPHMHRLSVSGGTAGALSLSTSGQNHHGGGLPPGSPLLEAYHGTYQSISPMPSPLMLPSTMDDGLSDLEPLSPEYSSDDSHHRRRPIKSILKKRVVIYDPEDDALALAATLKHTKPETEDLVTILPRLSDDHMMALRTEYKKHIKVNGKGINIAKHIKLKVPGNLGKIAYATALGRWESEAHWANFWYQSGSSRRELLIESLMGRTNSEIRAIKEAFSDKRYNDSLEKCMQTELKKDKFRNAVLLALEEKRMDELMPLSVDLIRRDTQDLYRALTAKEGGETAMINIIVVRSDTHLREVLRAFESNYRRNFAREMIQKSKNLVVRLFPTPSLPSPLQSHPTHPFPSPP